MIIRKLLPLLGLSRASSAALDASRFLWYSQPATEWEKGALPIGNGRMGATIYGSLDEIVTISEDTIWSGPFQDRTPVNALKTFPVARQMFIDGNITGGGDLVIDQMNQPEEEKRQREFSYFGDLQFSFGHDSGEVDAYTRWLDTREGHAGVSYVREYIASYPGDILAVRFQASEDDALNVNASISRSNNTVENVATSKDGLHSITFRGSSGQPSEENPITFVGVARLVSKGGKVSASESSLIITGATTVDVFFDTETNYRYAESDTLEEQIDQKLSSAIRRGFEAVRKETIQDVTDLIGRASIDLGKSPSSIASLPTDKRVELARSNLSDVELATLTWNLGRHMLVGSSRDTKADMDLPANLQGVWNNNTGAAWGGKYTININTEMNYWLSMTTNLFETHSPLFDLIKLAEPRGAKLARDMYDCDGVVFHHNLDVWGDPAPTDKYRSSSMWPMGAAWLVQEMLEHYRFTGDKDFLADTAYPFLVEVAKFYKCYTFEHEGYRVTGPSLSPENEFVVPDNMSKAGQGEPMDIAIPMDDQLMYDVFNGLVEAARVLGKDDEEVAEADKFIAKIHPPRIGSLGQILEWRHEYAEKAKSHRHLSHLYALHPGTQFSPLANATLGKAAGVSVDGRRDAGSGSTGWSRAWLINMYARLHRGEDAWDQVRAWFAKYPTAGLWNTDKGATFQIDGNFGFTAGVAEMLLQSHAGLVHILPALPAETIPRGRATGLTARGGFVVDVEWEQGRFKRADVTSKLGSDLEVRVGDGGHVSLDGRTLEGPVKTKVGATYHIEPITSP